MAMASGADLQQPSLLRMLSRSGQGPIRGGGGGTGGAGPEAGDGGLEEGDVLLKDLPTPSFIINRHAFAQNCQSLLDYAKSLNEKAGAGEEEDESCGCNMTIQLRPHIKTHKTLEGIHLQANGTSSSPNHLVAGFVASTIPEMKLLVNYYTRRTSTTGGGSGGRSSRKTRTGNQKKKSSSQPSSILFGIPISETKIPPLYALQERLNQWRIQWNTISQSSGGLEKPTQIILLMDHIQQIEMVKRFVTEQQQDGGTPNPPPIDTSIVFPVMIKLDTGYHRAGVPTTDTEEGIELVKAIVKAPFLKFKGVYSHCGHAYDEEDATKIDEIAQNDMNRIQSFLQKLEETQQQQQKDNNNLSIFNDKSNSNKSTDNKEEEDEEEPEDFIISVGSTPSLFHHYNPTTTTTSNDNSQQQQQWWKEFVQRYPQVQLEFHPGNYTMYDRQQLYTKACPSQEAIAGRVLTRVIGHYNDVYRPDTILLDAGATALTKETTPQGGMAAITGCPGADVYKMSQEVSMARLSSSSSSSSTESSASLREKFPLGSILTLLPNHSCLAAACFDKFYIIDDPTNTFGPAETTPVVDEWEPVKGW